MAEVVEQGVAVQFVSRVQVRAVLSGLVVAGGVFAVCMGLSWAIGLSTFRPTADHARGLALGNVIWGAIALWISLFIGGLIAAQVGRSEDARSGIFHGLVVWGATAALGGFLLLSMFSGLLGGLAQLSQAGTAAGDTRSIGHLANVAGITIWLYWAGIVGGLFSSMIGGLLGARREARVPRPEGRTYAPNAPRPAY